MSARAGKNADHDQQSQEQAWETASKKFEVLNVY